MNQTILFFKKQKGFQSKVEGNSMFPLLQSGDILSFKKIVFSKIHINDLVIVKKKGQVFTHRAIYKCQKYLITKGDNNLTADGRIYPKQILGKVYQVKRNGCVFKAEIVYLLQLTLYFQEIVKIKKAFEKEKIDFVFLKGLPLHLYFEKTHPKRIYADCDMLVDKNCADKADKILRKLKYKKAKTEYSHLHKLLKDKKTEDVFVKEINNFPVAFDIHYEASFLMNQLGRLDALYPQKMIDQMTTSFLKEKQIIKIENELFPILSSINLVIYLSLHIFHHNYQGAFRLELLDKVIRNTYNNNLYLSLSRKIKNYQLQNFIYPVFLLLKKYYGTPLRYVIPAKSRFNILDINIFDDKTRLQAGINRFKNLFFLSPNPLPQRLFIILNPQVIYSFFWVMIFLVRRSLRENRFSSCLNYIT